MPECEANLLYPRKHKHAQRLLDLPMAGQRPFQREDLDASAHHTHWHVFFWCHHMRRRQRAHLLHSQVLDTLRHLLYVFRSFLTLHKILIVSSRARSQCIHRNVYRGQRWNRVWLSPRLQASALAHVPTHLRHLLQHFHHAHVQALRQ